MLFLLKMLIRFSSAIILILSQKTKTFHHFFIKKQEGRPFVQRDAQYRICKEKQYICYPKYSSCIYAIFNTVKKS